MKYFLFLFKFLVQYNSLFPWSRFYGVIHFLFDQNYGTYCYIYMFL